MDGGHAGHRGLSQSTALGDVAIALALGDTVDTTRKCKRRYASENMNDDSSGRRRSIPADNVADAINVPQFAIRSHARPPMRGLLQRSAPAARQRSANIPMRVLSRRSLKIGIGIC
jgi:hypothetical protein